jgi:NitT/TauT family transport system substrate-binding protein
MQLILMQDRDFLSPRAKEAGVPDLKIEFVTVTGPTVINDSLVSGALDIGAFGASSLITLWDKTHGSNNVRGVVGMNVMPLLLVSRDPRIKTIADYGPADRIALPAIKVSMQAMMLDLLAAKTFGEGEFRKLDPNTVSIGHPDATAGLISGGAPFTSHFGSLPFQHIELAHPGIHLVASSFDAIGPHSVGVMAATTRFRTQNPKVMAAFVAALQDATDFINGHQREAAEAYLRVTKEKSTPDEIVQMMNDPGVAFTLRPQGLLSTAEFMAKTGMIKQHPTSWKDMYFDTVPGGEGS